MSRIRFDKGLQENFIEFSGGNPGALTMLFEIYKVEGDNCIKYLLILDNMKLYEDKIYMLWNDSCNRDIKKVIKILDYYDAGKITQQDIDERIKNIGWGKKFDDLLGDENG